MANCYGHDDFVVSALVLGHSIHKTTIALISENESKDTQNALQSVGWETLLVEEMDCSWMDSKFGGDRNSGLFGRPLGLRIKTLKISRVDLRRV